MGGPLIVQLPNCNPLLVQPTTSESEQEKVMDHLLLANFALESVLVLEDLSVEAVKSIAETIAVSIILMLQFEKDEVGVGILGELDTDFSRPLQGLF